MDTRTHPRTTISCIAAITAAVDKARATVDVTRLLYGDQPSKRFKLKTAVIGRP